MRKVKLTVAGIGSIVLLGAVAVLWNPSLAQQGGGQGQPGGGQGRRPGGPGGPPGGFDFSQFLDRMLDRFQLNEVERAAAKETWTTKNNARMALMEKIGRLREVSENPQSSDADIGKALNEFATAYGTYAKAVSDADAKLVKKISLRTRARLTAGGILENGVGFGMMFRGGGEFRRPEGGGAGSRPGGGQ